MIEKREFGSTGHQSTRLLFGAAAFYNTQDQDAVMRTMDQVDQAGINHIDTAQSYGESQRLMGPWLKHNRHKVFLATKTEHRTYAEAKAGIYESLELMQVDSVDLWQMHCLSEPEEWEKAKDEEKGTLRAFKEARDEGLVRFLGVTSHGMKAPSILTDALQSYPFDSVLVPCNYIMMQNQQYRQDYQKLYALCEQKGTAIQIIKTICKGPWPEGAEQIYDTWYEPMTDQEDIDTSIGWTLKQERVFINSAGEMKLLHKVIEAAQQGKPLVSDEQMARCAKRIGMKKSFCIKECSKQ